MVKVVSLGLVLMLFGSSAKAQKKIDLDDLSVKGELQNDSRLKLNARESAAPVDRVKYRTNYRPEILETHDLPELDKMKNP